MCIGKDTANETFIFKNINRNMKEQKILGFTIDNRLKLKSHVKKLCKKSKKIVALSRLSNHLNDSGTIIRTGITCQKIPHYIRDSACRWRNVKNGKIF